MIQFGLYDSVASPPAGIDFDTVPLAGASTADVVRHGLVLIPEGRHVFPRLSVGENLRIGLAPSKRDPYPDAFSRKDRAAYLQDCRASLSSTQGWRTGASRRTARCRAARGRCSRSGGRSWRSRAAGCSISPRWGARRS
jgi:hypothetical protein